MDKASDEPEIEYCEKQEESKPSLKIGCLDFILFGVMLNFAFFMFIGGGGLGGGLGGDGKDNLSLMGEFVFLFIITRLLIVALGGRSPGLKFVLSYFALVFLAPVIIFWGFQIGWWLKCSVGIG